MPQQPEVTNQCISVRTMQFTMLFLQFRCIVGFGRIVYLHRNLPIFILTRRDKLINMYPKNPLLWGISCNFVIRAGTSEIAFIMVHICITEWCEIQNIIKKHHFLLGFCKKIPHHQGAIVPYNPSKYLDHMYFELKWVHFKCVSSAFWDHFGAFFFEH